MSSHTVGRNGKSDIYQDDAAANQAWMNKGFPKWCDVEVNWNWRTGRDGAISKFVKKEGKVIYEVEYPRRHSFLGMLVYDITGLSQWRCAGCWRWRTETWEREGRKIKVQDTELWNNFYQFHHLTEFKTSLPFFGSFHHQLNGEYLKLSSYWYWLCLD